MHLPRHTISSHAPSPLFSSAAFSSPLEDLQPSSSSLSSPSSSHRHLHDHPPIPSSSSANPSNPSFFPSSSPSPFSSSLPQPSLFTCATPSGFLVAHSSPPTVVARRHFPPSQGGLSHAVAIETSSLLVLVGGGRVPRFAPNKVILWDQAAIQVPSHTTLTQRRARSGAADTSSLSSSLISSSPSSSPRASTIFSAGSGFDSQHSSNSTRSFQPGTDDLSSSSSDSSQLSHQGPHRSLSVSSDFSTSSVEGISKGKAKAYDSDPQTRDESGILSHSQQVEPKDVLFSGHELERVGTSSLFLHRGSGGEMDESMQASSIGIGRMQSSTVLSTAFGAELGSLRGQARASQLSSSVLSAAILASSANLDDPFQSDTPPPEPEFVSRSSPSNGKGSMVTSRSISESLAKVSLEDEDVSVPRTGSSSDLDRSSPKSSLKSSRSSRQSGVRGREGVERQQVAPLQNGREVAELEFGEAVRGVCVRSFAIRPRSETGSRGSGPSTGKAGRATLLIVLLKRKAMVFEMGSHIEQKIGSGEAEDGSWGIVQRMVVDTHDNLDGLAAISRHPSTSSPWSASALIALPGRQTGHVQLARVKLGSKGKPTEAPLSSSSPSGASTIIVAHTTRIACMALSPCGSFLATASEKGTLLRIWSTTSSQPSRSTANSRSAATTGRTGFGSVLLRELRRGTDTARILSMAFSPDSKNLAAASDKGTVHIFRLEMDQGRSRLQGGKEGAAAGGKESGKGSGPLPSPTSPSSKGPSFGSAAAKYLPSGLGTLASHIPPSVVPQYFKSEWSSAQFRVPLISFGSKASVGTSGYDGGFDSMVGGGGGARAGGDGPIKAGVQPSTEGAWATMKGRIEDVRRGEVGVDEGIFLGWITLPLEDLVDGEVPGNKGTRDPSKVGPGRVREERKDEEQEQEAVRVRTRGSKDRNRLIVLTTSGGWYRLALDEIEGDGDTVLRMYKEDSSSGGLSDKSTRTKAARDRKGTVGCTLEEYRRFGGNEDGWELF
ncbi:hypothetical protein IE53DRAFT_404654 [Violaceomyces palustris]|uniref:Uncharacterized protein n=1 Tax=Violaceomyces palustris TaxID=1673888 RepID=A0ACD0P5J8_9BASI|nr:hypothetical protein IE53DRAFT_404654 [Violaceomyces palustris]